MKISNNELTDIFLIEMNAGALLKKKMVKVISDKQTVVVDCVTLWLTNFFVDTKYDIEKALEIAKEEINKLVEIDANIIIISNEIGMGLHANSESGIKFTQLQGWTNQHIAKLADKATFMVSGLPLTLK